MHIEAPLPTKELSEPVLENDIRGAMVRALPKVVEIGGTRLSVGLPISGGGGVGPVHFNVAANVMARSVRMW